MSALKNSKIMNITLKCQKEIFQLRILYPATLLFNYCFTCEISKVSLACTLSQESLPGDTSSNLRVKKEREM
jgi:hypothetical protein